jgi:hypothetical protein
MLTRGVAGAKENSWWEVDIMAEVDVDITVQNS